MDERDIILEDFAEFSGPSKTTPARWLGQATPECQLSPTKLEVRFSARNSRRRNG